ncbi:MAG: ATP-binding protein [Faecousia sp.]
MRIYSMTATFGKLEHQTLTLKPGLNVIHAPNEWGKSTWCAFLLAMLYGLDTRAKATRASLPDKERYAPWSGSPMSGRMELSWNGRDITIERTTKGRIPLGEFRAYETASGLEVPELNASNCGQLLLGVERSVFQRAGFIRQAELPLTQDDALRRRLNALVTTGDESGDAARLEKGLRELKNRCRYNRSGLLPQARQQRDALHATLAGLEALQARQEKTVRALEENAARQEELTNHAAALSYAQAQADAEKVSRAAENYRLAQSRLAALEEEGSNLPGMVEIEEKLARLRAYREQLEDFQQFQQALPLPPELPQTPACFLGLTPAQAAEQAEADERAYRAISSPWWWLLLSLGVLSLLGAGVLLWQHRIVPGAVCAAAGCLAAALAVLQRAGQSRRKRALFDRYGTHSPTSWRKMAEHYVRAMEDYRCRELSYRRSQEELTARRRELKQHQSVCGGKRVEQCSREWEAYHRSRLALEEARADALRAAGEYEALKAMARSAPPPAREDRCRESAAETAELLHTLREQEQQLRSKSGEYRGRMEALGSRQELERRLGQLDGRIRELERYDAALALAQQTLQEATQELQRRFAPQISREARTFLSQLTLGRYDRLHLGADLSVQSGARQEDILRDARWRSDGTADQLYLALRLSVAQTLTPDAPLVLDDALVRFDEQRLEAAMEVLREMAQSRQVILFTCQEREQKCQPLI